jgi:predicted GIY-YIG superfamily endonuclease
MMGEDLLAEGFVGWVSVNALDVAELRASIAQLHSGAATYVVRARTTDGHLRGFSDIVYIGESDDLRRRIGEHRYQDSEWIWSDWGCELAWCWAHSKSAAHELQNFLLRRFEIEHLQLPACNWRRG